MNLSLIDLVQKNGKKQSQKLNLIDITHHYKQILQNISLKDLSFQKTEKIKKSLNMNLYMQKQMIN